MNMTSETIQQPAPLSPSKLLDLNIPPFPIWCIVLATATLAFGLTILIASGDPRRFPSLSAIQKDPFPFAILYVLAWVAIVLWLHYRRRRQLLVTVSDTLRSQPGYSPGDLVEEFASAASLGMTSQLQAIARTFVAQGRTNLTIRACKAKFARSIEPIAVPFEPLPLDESLPAVEAITSTRKTDDTADAASGSDPCTQSGHSMFWRRLRRYNALGGGIVMLVMFGCMWGMRAYRAVMEQRITADLIIWTALFLSVIFGVGRKGAWRANNQWLLVPGGLITRTSKLRKQDWQLHLYDRRRSALIAYRTSHLLWAVCVADAHSDQRVQLTTREATALLSAWLSPLEPPDPNRLTDLT